MLMLARIVGMVVALAGTVVAVNPNAFRAIINFWKHGKNVYIAGTARLLFGVLFLAIASRCRSPFVLYTLGALMITGGTFIFVIGPQRMRKIFGWWEKKPLSILRLVGVIALAIGALIIYSI